MIVRVELVLRSRIHENSRVELSTSKHDGMSDMRILIQERFCAIPVISTGNKHVLVLYVPNGAGLV